MGSILFTTTTDRSSIAGTYLAQLIGSGGHGAGTTGGVTGGGGGGGYSGQNYVSILATDTINAVVGNAGGTTKTTLALNGGAALYEADYGRTPAVDSVTGGAGGTANVGSETHNGGTGGNGGGGKGGGGGAGAGLFANGNNGANGAAGGAGGAAQPTQQTVIYYTGTGGGGNGGTVGVQGGNGENYGGAGGGAADLSGSGNGKDGAILLTYFGVFVGESTNSGCQTAVASYSWAHICEPGNDRYLVVGVSLFSTPGTTVTGITYNGVAMSLIRGRSSAVGAIRAELWGLLAPATGSNTVEVTLSAAIESVASAVCLNGVDQNSPTEAGADASATNVGAADATVNVTTIKNADFVIDCVATSDTAITVGADQTALQNVSCLGTGGVSYEGPKSPAGSVTMSWTDVDAAQTWSIVAVGIRPSADPADMQWFRQAVMTEPPKPKAVGYR